MMGRHREHLLPELPRVGGLMVRSLLRPGRPGPDKGLPGRSAVVEGHTQDLGKLAAYSRVTGFGIGNSAPATWLHVLTFPLQVHLMSQPDFPFPLAGVVHVSNEMTMHRAVGADERLRLASWTENLAPHKRGVTFDLCGEVRVSGELVWQGRSTYIAMGKQLPGDPPPSPPRLEAPDVAPSQLWRLPSDLGRQYAKVSGDPNPIHLYRLTALPFGFKRPIIHGMWTHAKALSSLGPRLPEAFTAKVAFTKPIQLPGKVQFAVSDDLRFAVLGTGGKPHLVGAIS